MGAGGLGGEVGNQAEDWTQRDVLKVEGLLSNILEALNVFIPKIFKSIIFFNQNTHNFTRTRISRNNTYFTQFQELACKNNWYIYFCLLC